MDMNKKEIINTVLNETKKAVRGKDDVLRSILTAILAGGHILIDDIPGVGKTTIAVAFSHALGLDYKRVQFTPDVLPSDITGFSMYDKSSDSFRYMPGAAVTNFLLADEINRASPKTQSALLEVMQEGKLSVDGKSYDVPKPFIVMATQNPIGSSGTQDLPESQTDRFMIRISIGYPSKEDEINILKGITPASDIQPVLTGEALCSLQEDVKQVHMIDDLYAYIVSLAHLSRHHKDISLGISPRGAMALAAMSRAAAFIDGRDYVTPDDIQKVIPFTWGHRISLTGDARMTGKTTEQILNDILHSIPVPTLTEA